MIYRKYLNKAIRAVKRNKIFGYLYLLLRKSALFVSQMIYKIRFCFKPIRSHKIVFLWSPQDLFSGNLKAIVLELLKNRNNKLDIVCIVGKHSLSGIPEGVRGVDYYSGKALYELATAKIWVFHGQSRKMFTDGMKKRKGQYLIQTWHGSLGIKKIGTLVSDNNPWGLYFAKLTSGETDFWISNSTFETNVYTSSFPCVNEVLLYGHPRNDILVNTGKNGSDEIKHEFNVIGKKILLYAPSYRDSERTDCFNIDKKQIITSLESRFGGEWVIMYRLHPQLKKYGSGLIPGSAEMIDATNYPDIQDLMLGVDALLTDFSSCIFDFMLTGRPGFIYAPDLDQFEQDRGFYYPLESTPFPIGRTNEELAEKIRSFDEEKYAKDVAAFLEDKGCMEDGHASERVVQKISELMKD